MYVTVPVGRQSGLLILKGFAPSSRRAAASGSARGRRQFGAECQAVSTAGARVEKRSSTTTTTTGGY